MGTMNKGEIKVTVNGLAESVPHGVSVTFLVEHFAEDSNHCVVEWNGQYVYPGNWSTTLVEEGDVIELINPNFGG